MIQYERALPMEQPRREYLCLLLSRDAWQRQDMAMLALGAVRTKPLGILRDLFRQKEKKIGQSELILKSAFTQYID